MDESLRQLEREASGRPNGSPEQRRYFVALLRAGKKLPVEVNTQGFEVVMMVYSTRSSPSQYGVFPFYYWRRLSDYWSVCAHKHLCHRHRRLPDGHLTHCRRTSVAVREGRAMCNCAQKAAWNCLRRYLYNQLVEAVLAEKDYQDMIKSKKFTSSGAI